MAYHKHEDQYFEVLWIDQLQCNEWNKAEGLSAAKGDYIYQPGYYYAFGVPGCLWDSEPFGPHSSEEAAYDAAIEQLSY